MPRINDLDDDVFDAGPDQQPADASRSQRFKTRKPRSGWRWLVTLIVLPLELLVGVSAAWGALHLPSVTPFTQACSFTGCLVLASVGLLVITLAARLRFTGFVALVLVIVTGILFAVPRYLRHGPTQVSAEATVRVLSANLQFGHGAPDLARQLQDLHPDLVILAGCDSTCLQRVQTSPYAQDLPYSVAPAHEGAGGTAILSRYPVQAADSLAPRAPYDMPAATVQIGGSAVTVQGVHTQQPLPGKLGPWLADLKALQSVTRTDGAVIMAGDFNATTDHDPLAHLLDTNTTGHLTDVSADTGTVHGTWPSRWNQLVAAPLDHVLVRGFKPVTSHVVSVKGSDHRALLAVVETKK